MFSKGNEKDATTAAAPAPRSPGKAAMPSIISTDLTVSGNLVSDGDIQVEGTIEGDVKSRTLTIGQSGAVRGTVVADTVQVSGEVTGEIRAATVTLAKSARVSGDIWHDTLAIEAGARMEGTCKRLEGAAKETVVPKLSVGAGRRAAEEKGGGEARPGGDDGGGAPKAS